MFVDVVSVTPSEKKEGKRKKEGLDEGEGEYPWYGVSMVLSHPMNLRQETLSICKDLS